MDREIKFRGKQLEYPHVWIYGQLTTNRYGNAYILDQDDFNREIIYSAEPDDDTAFVKGLVEVDPDTVGEYINLKDKSNTEIYEGDVIKDSYGHIHIIKYNEQEARFIAANTQYVLYNNCSITQAWINEFDKEVVGNVHDNPELIE